MGKIHLATAGFSLSQPVESRRGARIKSAWSIVISIAFSVVVNVLPVDGQVLKPRLESNQANPTKSVGPLQPAASTPPAQISPLLPGNMGVGENPPQLRTPPSRNSLMTPLFPQSQQPSHRTDTPPVATSRFAVPADASSTRLTPLTQPVTTPSGPNQERANHVGGALLRKSTGNLCDVHFINSNVGIAVGSKGLIWRTIDGGRNWNSCVCPCDCDLVAVTFANDLEGWAVGGLALPLKGLHEGIVLKTTDGGLTWKRLQTILLPRLIDIQVTKDRRLWTTAIATAQHSQRIFESLDGGHSWNDVQFNWPKGNQSNTRSNAISLSESVSVSPAWHDGTRSVVSTAKGIVSIADSTGIYAQFDGVEQSEAIQFRSIAAAGKKLFAVSNSGDLLVSLEQGDRWLSAAPLLPAEIASEAKHFSLLESVEDDLWIYQPSTGRFLKYQSLGNQWSWQSLPRTSPIQSLHFVDKQNGCAVGPLGNVFRTYDGGATWTWEHSLHDQLAVLVVAANTNDVPPALLTQLAANNHLLVGILCGATDLPAHLVRDTLSSMDAGWIEINSEPFDSSNKLSQQRAIESCLKGLRPQILLVCPPTGPNSGKPVQAKDWIAIAQQIRKSLPVDPRNRWGTMGLTVELAQGLCDSSTSLDGYASALQQLLGDAAFVPNLLRQQWSDEPQNIGSAYQASIGIRRLASAGPNELAWFSSVGKLEPHSLNMQLSRFVGSTRPAPLFNLAQQASYKKTWINSFAASTTNSSELRSLWLRSLTTSLAQVPEQSRVTWLVELADYCEKLGDSRKSCLAWLEAWQSGPDEIAGLYALTRAISLLSSDELQWSNRLEATQLAQQEMLAMEQRMQQAIANGQTTEEAKFDEALRRWGINPEERDQVPPNIIARIKAMEKLRESKQNQALGEKEESLIEIPNFQTFANVAPAAVKQFDDRDGNKLTRNSTVVSWSASEATASSTVSQATHNQQESQSLPLTILDRLPEERIAHAFNLAKMADGLWPHLQSDSSWWKIKARLARDMGDIPQIETAWNRVLQYAANPQDDQSIALFEKLVAEFGNSAEESSLFDDRQSSSNDDKVSSKHRWIANWAPQRPSLDGNLAEPIWQNFATGQSLKISLSHDEQYLYLAIATDQPNISTANVARQSVTGARSKPIKIVRDAANESDAIRVHIDTDRDYQTDFVLCFDTEGRVTERQGTDKDWNPTLFLAQDREGDQWTIELALDLADLSLPRLGEYWHLRVEQMGGNGEVLSGWTRIRDPMEILP